MTQSPSDPAVGLLRGVPLFADCDEGELAEIARLATPVNAEPGAILVAEGDPGTDFYVIVDGRAVVSVEGEPVAEIGPGSFFGEMALLDGGERVATVTAAEPLELLALARDDFNRMLEVAMPALAPRLLSVVGRRVREQERREGRGTPFGV
jgi:CRP/FNR family transcriptional regulator, cyclic AMP receptor protein